MKRQIPPSENSYQHLENSLKIFKALEKKAEKYDALCDNVSALNEANRIDRENMKRLELQIRQIKYDNEN